MSRDKFIYIATLTSAFLVLLIAFNNCSGFDPMGLSSIDTSSSDGQEPSPVNPKFELPTRTCELKNPDASLITPELQAAYTLCLLYGRSFGTASVDAYANIFKANSFTYSHLLALIIATPDFQNLYKLSSLEDEDYVRFIYALLLDRGVEPSGLKSDREWLANGRSRSEFFDRVLQSEEFAGRHPVLQTLLLKTPSLALQGSAQEAPLSLRSAQMISPPTLAWGQLLKVELTIDTSKIGAAQLFVDLVNDRGELAAFLPINGYFNLDSPTSFKWEILLSSRVSPGVYTVRAGLRRTSGEASILNPGLARLTIPTYYPQDPRYKVEYNVAYGPDRAEVADLAVPVGAAKMPALIVIHGGGWISGDKFYFSPEVHNYATNGIAVMNLSYRLAAVDDLSTHWPAQLQDAQLAVRWLKANAARFNIDPQRICVLGGSAGGHLALFLGSLSSSRRGDRSALYADQSPQVSCVVDQFGPTDLTRSDVLKIFDPYAILFGGHSYLSSPVIYKEASPINFISEKTAPTFILHGKNDELIPLNQSQLLADAMRAKGVPYIFRTYEGGHSYIGVQPNVRTALDMEGMAFVKSILQK